MKIALVQMHVDDRWALKTIPSFLNSAAPGADLVVFPECMPFWNMTKPPAIEDAQALLVKAGKSCRGTAFMAGGYVKDGAKIRNAVFLLHDGEIKGMYFKRIPWETEKFDPGEKAVCFKWEGFACVPLICADAGDDPGPRRTRMVSEAIKAGAGKSTPIIVCSYGGGLRTSYWHEPLQAWSGGSGAPVAICGFAGTDAEQMYLDEDDVARKFGGGGSGVFWPDGTHSDQPTKRCIYIVDLDRRTTETRRLPR
jgi:predicted amidohydrolase